MIAKIIFLSLTVLFMGLTFFMYKRVDHTDDFGMGIVVIVSLILTVLFALCAYFLPIKH